MKIEKIRSKIFYTLLMLIIPMGLCAQQVWIEKDGYVSFESESTDSPSSKMGSYYTGHWNLCCRCF